jgi:hypothetical protein
MKFATVVLCAALLVSCRTGRPTGVAVAPLTATSADEALQQLRERRAHFTGMRSLMHVRATINGKTQSFRAQLHVIDAQRMELIAYTPVGTTAMTMKADGDRITSDPPIAPEAFNFLHDAGLTPAQTAMLLLGLPPLDDLRLDYSATGLKAASSGAMTVRFEPPSFPASRVIVTSTDDDDRIEIMHDEVVREN